jgi:hypothetical protein
MVDHSEQLPDEPDRADLLPALDGDNLPGVLDATPSGLPFPVSSGPANQGANDIKALALAVDPRLPAVKTVFYGGPAPATDANGDCVYTVAGITTLQGAIVNYYGPYSLIYVVRQWSGNKLTLHLQRPEDAGIIANQGHQFTMIAWGIA